MTYPLAIDAPIFEQFPDYQALILYAEEAKNFPSPQERIALLRSAEQECRNILTLEELAHHPHIAAWRDASRRFGAKPKKYPCSLEALLQRTLNWIASLLIPQKRFWLRVQNSKSISAVGSRPALLRQSSYQQHTSSAQFLKWE